MKKRLKKKIDKENTKKICKKLNGNLILASLIDQYKIKEENIEEFLNPKLENLNNPFLFNDMTKAVKRIKKAVEKNEKILIYGDYDADGNIATAILIHFFRKIGYKNVSYMIPSRLIDGYGISMDKILEIKEKNIDIIITVDCGIKNIEEIEELNRLNIDVILTDHHEPGEKIPNAYSIINPKVKGEKYPYKELSGSGVSFKLACAMNEKMKTKLSQKDINLLMLISSIGTIGDVMMLTGENRNIIKLSLDNLDRKNLPAGLKLLTDSYEILNEEIIAYYIVPKINSSGRMGEELGIKLLIEENEKNAKKILNELENLNNERKILTEKGFCDVDKIIQTEKLYQNDFIFVGKNDLHEGIIGIIASKVSEKYNRPVAIYTNKSKEKMVGSSRCNFQDVNIYNFLNKFNEYFTAFGGHDFAAGFSFKIKNEKVLKEKISKEKTKKEDKILEYNNELNLNEATLELVKSMEVLKPYGNSHDEPLFYFKDLFVKKIYEYPKITRIIFSQKIGYKTNLKTNEKVYLEKEITAISFKNINKLGLKENENVNIYASLRINSFRGNESLQLFI